MKITLFVFALLVSGASTARAEECSLMKIAALPISDDEGGSPIVPVTINGTERKFLVDTGGAFSGMSSAAVKELGLHQMPIENYEIYGMSGEKIKKFVSIEKMQIGVNSAKNAHLMVLDLPVGVDGILGPDYLENFDLDFDFSAHTLNLFSPKHCKGKVVYWTQDYVDVPFTLSTSEHIQVPMTLDGQKLLAHLDTGASRTILSMSSARSMFGLKDGSPELEAISGISEKEVVRYRHRFLSLSLEGIAVRNPLIYFHEDAAQRAFNRNHTERTQLIPEARIELEKQDLMVGMNILSKLHLYIAYKERMLYASAASAH